jgi:hypothetical protein
VVIGWSRRMGSYDEELRHGYDARPQCAGKPRRMGATTADVVNHVMVEVAPPEDDGCRRAMSISPDDCRVATTCVRHERKLAVDCGSDFPAPPNIKLSGASFLPPPLPNSDYCVLSSAGVRHAQKSQQSNPRMLPPCGGMQVLG